MLAGGDTPFFFSCVGVENGLSQNSVLKISQDIDGFLWFGTRNGLNRYDGNEFVVYRHIPGDTTTLSNNYINSLAPDKKGNLWIATSNGFNHMETATGKIRRYYPGTRNRGINALCVGASGQVYASVMDELYVYCAGTDRFERISGGVFPTLIRCLAEHPDGSLYIGTAAGLYRYNPSSGKTKRLYEEIASVQTLLADRQGVCWLSTDERDVYACAGDTVSPERVTNRLPLFDTNVLRSLIEYNDSTLLVGTSSGLCFIDRRTRRFVPCPMQPEKAGALSHCSVYDLFRDSDGTLWVGTYAGGANYCSPYTREFTFIAPKEYTGVIGKGEEDRNGALWFATEGAGLLRLDPNTGEQTVYPLTADYRTNLYGNIIKSLCIRGDSIFCATNKGAVYLFSIRNERYRLLYDFKYNDIYTLYADSCGRLWIPTYTASDLVLADGRQTTSLFPVADSVRAFRYVRHITEIRPDVFLFGTTEGVYLYDMPARKVDTVCGMEGGVAGIVRDAGGSVWIAGRKGRVCRFDNRMRLTDTFNAAFETDAGTVLAVVVDAAGTLWLQTASALLKLDKHSRRFVTVRFAPEFMQEFTPDAVTRSGSGKLYLAGHKGLVSFNPLTFRRNPVPPRVHLISLDVNNRRVRLGDETAILHEELHRTRHITLKWNQTNIVVRYAALDFVSPAQSRYACMLEGLDASWREAGSQREAYFSNLAPGRYEFRVKASDTGGMWASEIAALRITVLPPLWRTWWAYLLYLLVTGAVTARFISFRNTRRELENNIRFEQLEQRKTNELHQERMRLFTHFAHELRTPLTLIVNPLNELLRHASFSEELKSTFLLMRKNTERLLLLVDNLMDVQKYETGKMVLQPEDFEFEPFVREIYASFVPGARQRSIAFEWESRLPPGLWVTFDRGELEKVFFNLLSNAFKFTPAGGVVRLSVKLLGKEAAGVLGATGFGPVEKYYLYAEVTDTGRGLEGVDKEKIFEPFYRSTPDLHRQVSGSGIGLSLSRAIVRRHRGVLWVESLVRGTSMRLLLPVGDKPVVREGKAAATELPLDRDQLAAALLAGKEPPAKRPAEHPQATLLLIEDNKEVLSYLEQYFSSGYQVIKAPGGKEALDALVRTVPDLVVSDVMMPGMDGLELCRRLKNNERTAHIPVILLTAKALPHQVKAGLEAGADAYLVKPFDVSLLHTKIKNLLAAREKMKNKYARKIVLEKASLEVTPADEEFLCRYTEVIKAGFSDPSLDVDRICAELNMSRANFYRKARSLTQVSPAEMIKKIRLETAAQLLCDTDLTVTQILDRVGFGSSSYFAVCFRAMYGLTPKEYRRRHKAE
ncbi:MAG: response regulator [Parabacteroides sp.]|nr:response regulator [Parabacteroides sp.]